MEQMQIPEPWLRGTLQDVPPVLRAVLHALELAQEDVNRWCRDFGREALNSRLHGLPSLAFQVRHIGRSIDRLLTYAEGKELSDAQLKLLASESDPDATAESLFREFDEAIRTAMDRIRPFSPAVLNEPRHVGRKRLPTTVAGLLVHVADHTQRHVGQAITTAKLLRSMAGSEPV